MLALASATALVACSSDAQSGNGGAAWKVCPTASGAVTADTYDGQHCAGSLQCAYFSADCPNLSGYGPVCNCVDGRFECGNVTCGGQTSTGNTGGADAGGQ